MYLNTYLNIIMGTKTCRDRTWPFLLLFNVNIFCFVIRLLTYDYYDGNVIRSCILLNHASAQHLSLYA